MTITAEIKERSRVTKEEWKEFTKTVWHIANVSDSNHPAVFPSEIPRRLIKLFTFWGETVLDPFGGVGTTALAALELERQAICVDQNAEYVKLARSAIASRFNGSAKLARFWTGDSRKLKKVEDNSIGLVVTSPPYWNKADYGGNGSNLGSISGYKDFYRSIRPVFEECFRSLMPGRKVCVVTANVNQHTNHGLLTFPLSADFVNLLRDIGFVMINEIIWSKDKTGGKWGSYGAQRPIFGSYPYPPNFLFKNVHEYIIIFAKPLAKPKTGKKVQQYEQLMELPEDLHQRSL
jgi:site-specific DNA-methyltransferase (adenine-specific)